MCSEIYLKPVTRYVRPYTEPDFYTVTASAAALNESAIGYRITSQSQNPDQTYGVYLNPNKSKKVTFSEDDLIIVLSED